MSLHRVNPRRDGNEALLVEAFRAWGCHVLAISGTGLPDLIVFRPQGEFLALVEVKKPKTGRARPAQLRFKANWRGPQPVTCRTLDDVDKLLRTSSVPVIPPARSEGG